MSGSCSIPLQQDERLSLIHISICRRLGFSPMLISVDTRPSYSCAPRASAARSCSAANAARSSSQVGNSDVYKRQVAKVTRGFVHMETEVVADELEVLQGLADKQAA